MSGLRGWGFFRKQCAFNFFWCHGVLKAAVSHQLKPGSCVLLFASVCLLSDPSQGRSDISSCQPAVGKVLEESRSCLEVEEICSLWLSGNTLCDKMNPLFLEVVVLAFLVGRETRSSWCLQPCGVT